MWRIILKCPTATRLNALARWKHSLRIMPSSHLGSMRGTTGTPRLRSPLLWSRPRHQRLDPFLILSRRHLRRPWARHPGHPVVVLFFLSPSTHPMIASTIQTLVQTRDGRGGGGRNTTNTSIHGNPLRGGEPPKNRTNLLSSSGRWCPIARNTPQSLRPHGPVQRRTPLRWGTTIPSRKMFSPPPGSLLTRPLILRIHVQFLQ